jgi:hypothetical protein
MRTRYWAKEAIKVAMEKGKIEREADFFKACRDPSSILGAMYDIPWDSYLKGVQSPQTKFLKLVEDFAPGSMDCFEVGPYGIELWKVLQAHKSDKNLQEAESLVDQVLALEHRESLESWDLGLKAFWLVNPLLGFKLAPFEAEMVALGNLELREYGETRFGIRESDSLPWSDLQHLIERGLIGKPIETLGEEAKRRFPKDSAQKLGELVAKGQAVLKKDEEADWDNQQDGSVNLTLAELLAYCDDSRKLYSLEHAFRRFKTKLIDYSYESGEASGYSAHLIAAVFGLWHLSVAKSNHRVKYIAEVLIEGLAHQAIEDEFEELGLDLKKFALNMIK